MSVLGSKKIIIKEVDIQYNLVTMSGREHRSKLQSRAKELGLKATGTNEELEKNIAQAEKKSPKRSPKSNDQQFKNNLLKYHDINRIFFLPSNDLKRARELGYITEYGMKFTPKGMAFLRDSFSYVVPNEDKEQHVYSDAEYRDLLQQYQKLREDPQNANPSFLEDLMNAGLVSSMIPAVITLKGDSLLRGTGAKKQSPKKQSSINDTKQFDAEVPGWQVIRTLKGDIKNVFMFRKLKRALEFVLNYVPPRDQDLFVREANHRVEEEKEGADFEFEYLDPIHYKLVVKAIVFM